MKIKVALVDDEPLFTRGLRSLLEELDTTKVILEAENGKELIDAINQGLKPDLVLLDLEMPMMCGVQTTEYLHKNHPQIKIVILTSYDSEYFAKELIKKGAHEFLLKSFPGDTIAWVIGEVVKPQYPPSGSISKILLTKFPSKEKIRPRANPHNLSKREIEIIQCVALELTCKEISDKLCISPKTVGRHKENIQIKTGIKTTVGVLQYAIKYNLINGL